MRATIAVLSGNHLCHNPRVIKEASALVGAGYDVHIYGAWFDASLKARDEALLAGMTATFTPVIDLTLLRPETRGQQLFLRGRGKAAGILGRWVGVENRFQLGLVLGALSKAARKVDASLFVAHSEPALFVARALLRSGKRVGVDMEDWFSEDLLPEARRYRPIALLRDLERNMLRQGAHATCPSQAMSEALAHEHGCRPPTVIYNAFPWSDRIGLDGELKDRRNRQVPSVHWYSQTLGEGRGLEDLFDALPQVTHEAEIHLRGNPVAGFDDWMSSRIPERWRDRVFVHGLVPNHELLLRIAEHDIGFAGEMKYSRSRDLTVSNKMLQYLLAGLAVVASDTSGQREVASRARDAVVLYPSGDAGALAAQLNALLESRDTLQRAKAAALRAAEDTFCWERQEDRLLEAIASALEAPARKAETR